MRTKIVKGKRAVKAKSTAARRVVAPKAKPVTKTRTCVKTPRKRLAVKAAKVRAAAVVKKPVAKKVQKVTVAPKVSRTSVAERVPVVTPQSAFAALRAESRPGSLVFAVYEHEERVADYAMALFKDLQPMHRLDEIWRTRLLWAAYLHDIAVQDGAKGHHKAGKKRILEDTTLPIAEDDRPFVALLVRFHRKAIPTMKHRELMTLPLEARKKMIAAATLLRLADALDVRHKGIVKSVRGKFVDGVASIVLSGAENLKEEIVRAKKKVKGLLDNRVIFAAEELKKKGAVKSRPKKKAA